VSDRSDPPPPLGPGSRLIAVPAGQRTHRILLVEDDGDTREVLALALRGQAYDVIEAADPETGLQRLREGGWDLVIAHYSLPGKTAGVMLQEAAGEGLLQEVASLVITAHPEPAGVSAAQVLHKPLDITKFLLQVQRILGLDTSRASERPRSAAAAGPTPVHLTLFVSPGSPTSLRALRNYEQVAAGFDAGGVELEVCDVSREPEAAERDQVVFTPTLLKRSPEPPVWIVGDLSDHDVVASLLEVCGLRRRTAD
jgi:CheY-like chemotaxis protein